MFDKKFAEQYINNLMKKHKITVYAWSSSSCGKAQYKSRKIKIPKPTNIDRFAVCLHEIKHIIDGRKGKSFEREFACDMYARSILIEFGYEFDAWDKRTKWHILSRIAMSHNRGLNHNGIGADIREFFKDIDFTKWIGNKVFVGYEYYKSTNPADIKLTPTLSKDDVVMLLNRKGMMLDKSDRDDSTYGRWIVSSNGDGYGSDFGSLPEIVQRYQLAI